MDYGIRDTKVRLTDIEQTNSSAESLTPAQDQEAANPMLAAQDSIETGGNPDSVFSVDRAASQIDFGDGIQGKTPPASSSNIQATYGSGEGQSGNSGLTVLLDESKLRIKSYLSGQSMDGQLQEAKEKADLARDQATTGLVTGIVGGNVNISSAFSGLLAYAENARNEIAQNADVSKLQLESRFHSLSSMLQKQANEQDSQTKKLENQAANDDDFAKSSEDHNARMRDAILDFLKRLSELNPHI